MRMECRYCKRSFSKGEHLRRHERRHTGDQPFECDACQRSFNRQDSLARHQRLHGHKPKQAHLLAPSQLDHDAAGVEVDGTTANPTQHGNLFDQMTDQDFSGVLLDHSSTSTALGNFPPLDPDLSLIWPDSEDLFQSILTADLASLWQLPPGTFPLPTTLQTSDEVATPVDSIDRATSNDERATNVRGIDSGDNQHALHGVRQMISNFSSNITEAVDSTSITSIFLDQCLHMFFDRFIPLFPIMHRPTFIYRNTSAPLLLNAIAIGSLYLGPADSVTKGEVVWRLAHSAVATSWQSLIAQRGQYDACAGVQLVLAALLSVIYGVMSKNNVIRSASQALQASAFFWGRQCGMFECQPYDLTQLPLPSATHEEKLHQWRLWAAREIQQRAMLSHFILDGLIAHILGNSTSVRHTSNTLKLPNAELAFQAPSVDHWLACMQSIQHDSNSFRDIYKQLLVNTDNPYPVLSGGTNLSLRVIIEGIQSIIADSDADDGAIINPPAPEKIASALLWTYNTIEQSGDLEKVEKLEVLLRWHAVCLETITKTPQLCLYICKRWRVHQDLWPHRHLREHEFHLPSLVSQPAGRRLLLHAIAIQEIVEQLPRGRAHAIHLPSSLFAAATVYAAFSFGSQANVRLPSPVHWASALASPLNLQSLDQDTISFIHDNRTPTKSTSMTFKNVLYELNSVQKLFHTLKAQWGLASGMEKVIGQWIALCD